MVRPEGHRRLERKARTGARKTRRQINQLPQSVHDKAPKNKVTNRDGDTCRPTADSRIQNISFSADELECINGKSLSNVNSLDEDAMMIRYLERKLGITGNKKKEVELLRSVVTEEFGGDSGIVDSLFNVLDEYKTISDEDVASPKRRKMNNDDRCVSDYSPDSSDGDDSDEMPATADEGDRNAQCENDMNNNACPSDREMSEAWESCDEVAAETEDDNIPSEEPEEYTGLRVRPIHGQSDNDTDNDIVRDLPQPSSAGEDSNNDSIEPTTANTSSNIGYALPKQREHLQETPAYAISGELALIINRGLNKINEGNFLVIASEIYDGIKAEKDRICLPRLGAVPAEKIKELTSNLVKGISEYLAERVSASSLSNDSQIITAPQTALVCALSAKISCSFGAAYVCQLGKLFTAAVLTWRQSQSTAEKNAAFSIARVMLNVVSMMWYFGIMEINLTLLICQTALESLNSLIDHVFLDLSTIPIKYMGNKVVHDAANVYNEYKRFILGTAAAIETPKNAEQLQWTISDISNPKKIKAPTFFSKIESLKNTLLAGKGFLNGTAISAGELYTCNPRTAACKLLSGEIPHELIHQHVRLETHTGSGSLGSERIDALAAKFRIRSPLQMSIFRVILTRENPEQAALKLVGLTTHKRVSDSVVTVLLLCVINEKTPNPDYSAIMTLLANSQDESLARKFNTSLREALFALANSFGATRDDTKVERKINSLLHFIDAIESRLPGEVVNDIVKRFKKVLL